jgi:uncharacterized protein (TIGR04222 family)
VRNPLDLPGPEFLGFYAVVVAVVLAVLWVAHSSAASGPAPRLDVADPYLIAYLRGGTFEALRVATVTLIDRGLLRVDEAERTVKRRARVQNLGSPVEQALSEFFSIERPASDIFNRLSNAELRAACGDYERRLVDLGLLPDAERRAARRRHLTVALGVLVALAASKLLVALSRGRTNVLFLLVLAGLACWAAVKVARPFRTARGSAVLADLRRLFARLKQRGPSLRKGSGTPDAALLAAVFGLGALPRPAFAYARKLYPRTASGKSEGDGWGVGCGSSCGSGCGGGGCGGGCGGCSG